MCVPVRLASTGVRCDDMIQLVSHKNSTSSTSRCRIMIAEIGSGYFAMLT